MPVTQQLRRRALRVGAEIADEAALFSLLVPLTGPNEARAGTSYCCLGEAPLFGLC